MYMKALYELIAKDFKLAKMLLKTSNRLDEDGEATIVATSFGRAYIMKDLIPVDNKEIENAVFDFLAYDKGYFVDSFLLENVFTHEVELMECLSNDQISTQIVMAQIVNIYNLLCALEICSLESKIAAGQLLHFKKQLLEASSNWTFSKNTILKINNFVKTHGDSMHADYKNIFNNIKVNNNECYL